MEMSEQENQINNEFNYDPQDHPWLEIPITKDDKDTEAMRFALDEIRVR